MGEMLKRSKEEGDKYKRRRKKMQQMKEGQEKSIQDD